MPKTTEYGARYWRLEYISTAQNARKFYEVYIAENSVCVLRWGRIGTAGQSKATIHRSLNEAESVGLRQVYAKASKGYKEVTSDFHFLVSEEALNLARRGDAHPLNRVVQEALANGQFGGARDTVLKHYEDFAAQVQRLLHSAATDEFDVVMDQYDALVKVWADIEDKHREVVVSMDLAKQTLMQKLVGAI